MFGYVTANMKELTKQQQKRYESVYCGICRQIREQSSGVSRLGLSYDMAFLALLLMSRMSRRKPPETGPAAFIPPARGIGWITSTSATPRI